MFELRYCAGNQHGKCIHMSTNMPGIGSVIRKITFELVRILRKQTRLSMIDGIQLLFRSEVMFTMNVVPVA